MRSTLRNVHRAQVALLSLGEYEADTNPRNAIGSVVGSYRADQSANSRFGERTELPKMQDAKAELGRRLEKRYGRM